MNQCRVVGWFGPVLIILTSSVVAHAQQRVSDGAPVADLETQITSVPQSQHNAASIVAVDVYSRSSVLDYYNSIYDAPWVDPQWDGSVADCRAGSVSDEYREAIKTRINYFRNMAGVLPITALRENKTVLTFNDFAGVRDPSEAALIMSAQNDLSHTPGQTWSCYSDAGFAGANTSNLSLGSAGPEAITGYIEDPGAHNAAVGHRRWILDPPIMEMDSGDIPEGYGARPTNALQIIGVPTDETRSSREEFVAWPNPGYVPRPLVFPRWSFSMKEADFNNAELSVYRNGVAIEHQLEAAGPGAGLNSYVWIPAQDTDPVKDTLYTMQFDNINVGGETRSISYETVSVSTNATDGTDVDEDGVHTGQFEEFSLSGRSWKWYIESNSPLAQTFTRATPGLLAGVSLPIECDDDTTMVTVQIRNTVDRKPGSVVYGSMQHQASEFTTGSIPNWQRFDFPTPLDLSAGVQYAAVVQVDKQCNWYESETNSAGEYAYYGALSFAGLFENDLAIQTFVDPAQIDNCPTVANADQADYDSDNWGDACDIEVTLDHNQWYMLTLPALPPDTANTVGHIIGDDIPPGTQFSVYRYNTAAGQYEQQTELSVLMPNEGYWVIQMSGDSVNIDMPVGSERMSYVPSMRCSSALNCSPHSFADTGTVWDMYGASVSVPVPHDDLRISSTTGACADLDACNLSQAAASGENLLDPNLFNYNGSQYVSINSGSSLVPWRAYWLRLLAGSQDAQPKIWVPH
jgi:hypothetical protein